MDFYVDGEDYFKQIHHEILNAKDSMYLMHFSSSLLSLCLPPEFSSFFIIFYDLP